MSGPQGRFERSEEEDVLSLPGIEQRCTAILYNSQKLMFNDTADGAHN
jgi:hypothetical protein